MWAFARSDAITFCCNMNNIILSYIAKIIESTSYRCCLFRYYLCTHHIVSQLFLLTKTKRTQPNHLRLLWLLFQKTDVITYRVFSFDIVLSRFLLNMNAFIKLFFSLKVQAIKVHLFNILLRLDNFGFHAMIDFFNIMLNWIEILLSFLNTTWFLGITDDTTKLRHLAIRNLLFLFVSLTLNHRISSNVETHLGLETWMLVLNYSFSHVWGETQPRLFRLKLGDLMVFSFVRIGFLFAETPASTILVDKQLFICL